MKKEKIAKIIWCVILAAVIGAIVYFLSPFVLGCMVLLQQEKVIQNTLKQNPYYANDYADWQVVFLDEQTAFRIPKEWYLEQVGDQLLIKEKDTVIATGMIDRYADPIEKREQKWETFREQRLGFAPKEERREHFHIEEAQYYVATEKVTYIGENGESATRYELPLNTYTAANIPYKYYKFDFGSAEDDTDGTLLEIVLGIDFSITAYRYNDNQYKNLTPDITIVTDD